MDFNSLTKLLVNEPHSKFCYWLTGSDVFYSQKELHNLEPDQICAPYHHKWVKEELFGERHERCLKCDAERVFEP